MNTRLEPDAGADYRRRRRRQIALLILGLPFIAALGWFKAFPGQLNNPVAVVLAILALGYVAVASVFSLRNWRCLRCQCWLGNRLSPPHCRGCGARFEG
jgi:hypothetical protein